MRTGMMGGATMLLCAAGLGTLAGGSAECAAQAGADPVRERRSLGAAIAEARRSPFHAGATGAQHWNGRANEAGSVGTTALHPYQTARAEEHPLSGASIAATLVLAELSHLAVAFMVAVCGSGATACYVGTVLPLPVVALPAVVGEIGTGRALGASGGGWLGGAAAFLMIGHATGKPFAAGLVSGLVHAGLTIAILRG